MALMLGRGLCRGEGGEGGGGSARSRWGVVVVVVDE